jgi:F420-non-reducing hydrogenase iron-sulfur subunit
MNTKFNPTIVGFFCNWCTYLAADLAGTSRMKYAPNVRVVRTMCSGRVDPQMILWAFRNGADGVLIGGCHPGDCHYQEGNYKALRRSKLLLKMLPQFGIDACAWSGSRRPKPSDCATWSMSSPSRFAALGRSTWSRQRKRPSPPER